MAVQPHRGAGRRWGHGGDTATPSCGGGGGRGGRLPSVGQEAVFVSFGVFIVNGDVPPLMARGIASLLSPGGQKLYIVQPDARVRKPGWTGKAVN